MLTIKAVYAATFRWLSPGQLSPADVCFLHNNSFLQILNCLCIGESFYLFLATLHAVPLQAFKTTKKTNIVLHIIFRNLFVFE